jgi:hypothetical protein
VYRGGIIVDSVERCKKCEYWKSSTGKKAERVSYCDHLLATGKRRVSIDGFCHSFKERK